MRVQTGLARLDRPPMVACGQCRGCRLDRSREWAIRCVHEASLHERSCFVTLTYAELPTGGSLELRDWQLFAKRVRKNVGPFRFFHCGEYGEETDRPHYHAAIFGLDFRKGARLHSRNHQGDALYVSPLLEELWPHGFAPVGALTWQSAAYIARYVMKKQTGQAAKEVYGDRRPPYVTMSRRPGLGDGWFEKFGNEVFPADEVVLEGKKFQPPRYYDRKLGDEELAEVKARRIERVKPEDNTPERLEVRERVAEARLGRLSRGSV